MSAFSGVKAGKKAVSNHLCLETNLLWVGVGRIIAFAYVEQSSLIKTLMLEAKFERLRFQTHHAEFHISNYRCIPDFLHHGEHGNWCRTRNQFNCMEFHGIKQKCQN